MYSPTGTLRLFTSKLELLFATKGITLLFASEIIYISLRLKENTLPFFLIENNLFPLDNAILFLNKALMNISLPIL